MPRTPKDSITALRPTLEPELLKFVSAASKIFNLQLMPAAMMPPVKEDWVTLSYIHELQRQLNAKVQQEPLRSLCASTTSTSKSKAGKIATNNLSATTWPPQPS